MRDLTCWCYECKVDTNWEWHKNWERYECLSCGTLEKSDWPSRAPDIMAEEKL